MKAIKDHLRDFLAIIGLLLVAGVVSVYILNQQRFRFPLIEDAPHMLQAELRNAQAVTPGQGQTVEVAGVKIGRIGEVSLRDGRAIVDLEIFPRFKDVVREDASALLRPRTGLKDMFLELDPGSPDAPAAREGFTIPVSRTLTDVDLDEFLAELDTDVRAYLQLLFDGAGKGLKDRGPDLAELFRRFGPTTRDLRRVNRAVAREREALKDAIHGLSRLSAELSRRDQDLTELVDASAAVFESLAAEDRNVSATIRNLPEALSTATSTLQDVRRFALELGPASDRLVPVFRALDRANRAVRPVARDLTPVIRDEVRPFVREFRPLVGDLRQAARGLAPAFPDLTTAFSKLDRFVNMLGFNPNGAEPPSERDRQEGYLFWIAWVTHQTINLINIDDANGPLRPVFLTGTCDTLVSLINDEPELEFLMGLSGLLVEVCDDPQTRSLKPRSVLRDRERAAAAAKEANG